MTDTKTLPAFSVRMHDHRAVYNSRVGDRKLVYLDHNAWIELRDGKSIDAIECLATCTRAVDGQKAIFPLAFPAVTEAIEIADPTTRVRHADLLDALSLGVTFRAPPLLFALEAEHAYRWLYRDEDATIQRADAFTSLPDYLGESVVKFPEGWTQDKAVQFMTHLTTDPRVKTVRFIAEQKDWGPGHAPMREKYVRGMEENRRKRLAEGRIPKQANFARILLGERIALIKQYLFPAGRKVLLEEVGADRIADAAKELTLRKGEGGRRRIAELFGRMPITDQYARLLAADAMEVLRRPQAQDFYDIDHGTIPPIFADAFVTFDRRLARLVKDAGRSRADLVTNLTDLQSWLRRNCVD